MKKLLCCTLPAVWAPEQPSLGSAVPCGQDPPPPLVKVAAGEVAEAVLLPVPVTVSVPVQGETGVVVVADQIPPEAVKLVIDAVPEHDAPPNVADANPEGALTV